MSMMDDPNREAVGLAPIWTGAGDPPPEGGAHKAKAAAKAEPKHEQLELELDDEPKGKGKGASSS
jgi:hypothetical protein